MNYQDFVTYFKNKTAIDLNLYKEQQMRRRLETFIAAEIGILDYEKFINQLDKDKELFDRLKDRMTINVTEFYRNPAMWDKLKTDIIPELLKTKKSLNIWSAACSSGEEPYSLAMLLDENFKEVSWRILATDIDENILSRAKRGIYDRYQISTLSPHLKDTYFNETNSLELKDSNGFAINESVYEISDIFKNKINFRKHNLLADAFPCEVDLILCRNVVIYFTEESKAELYKKFHKSLRDGGMIVIGNTEHIVNYSNIGYEKFTDWTFRK